MNSLSVLVTGSRGYIGACVVPKLIEHGYEVAGVDTGWFSSNTGVADFSELSSEHLSRFDSVIHLAGLSDDKRALSDSFWPRVLRSMATLQVLLLKIIRLIPKPYIPPAKRKLSKAWCN